jgi:flagellar biosynthesis protein FliQ
MPHEGNIVTRGYETVMAMAALAAAACVGLIVLASLDLVTDLHVGGLSLWPMVMIALVASIFIASWAFAKSKGRSGWLGLILPLLDVFGLALLFKLEDRETKRHHE